jgi:hypothetical protein
MISKDMISKDMIARGMIAKGMIARGILQKGILQKDILTSNFQSSTPKEGFLGKKYNYINNNKNKGLYISQFSDGLLQKMSLFMIFEGKGCPNKAHTKPLQDPSEDLQSPGKILAKPL